MIRRWVQMAAVAGVVVFVVAVVTWPDRHARDLIAWYGQVMAEATRANVAAVRYMNGEIIEAEWHEIEEPYWQLLQAGPPR